MTAPLELWADGACSGNGTADAAGGWACLLIYGRNPADSGKAREIADAALTARTAGPLDVPGVRALALWGAEQPTTNNRMEQRGLLAGLQALKRPSAVTVHLDSNYVMQAFTKRWLANWQRNGWRNSKKQPVPNRDLWELLIAAAAPHTLVFTKVRGHAGVDLNECVDQLAVQAGKHQR